MGNTYQRLSLSDCANSKDCMVKSRSSTEEPNFFFFLVNECKVSNQRSHTLLCKASAYLLRVGTH